MSASECPLEFVEQYKEAKKKKERKAKKREKRLRAQMKAYVAEKMNISLIVRALREKRKEQPEGSSVKYVRGAINTWCWSYRYKYRTNTRDYRRFDNRYELARFLEKEIGKQFEPYCEVKVSYFSLVREGCGCCFDEFSATFKVTLHLIKEEFDKFMAQLEDKSYSSGSSSSA